MRIIHVADLHLNKAITKTTRAEIPLGVYDTLARLDFAIDYTRSVGASVFIIAGDIFDTRNPLPEYRQMFYDRLMKLNGVTVILITGNHDKSPNGKEHSIHDIASLVRAGVIVADSPSFVELDGIRYVLIPWQYSHDLPVIEAGPTTIAVCHASIEGVVGRRDRPLLLGEKEFLLTPDYFANCDYVAMGHIHHPQTIGQIVYPGSVNVLDWGESDPHYLVDIAVTTPVVTWHHVPYPIVRPRYDLVYAATTAQDVVFPDMPPDSLCRITINWSGQKEKLPLHKLTCMEYLLRQTDKRHHRPVDPLKDDMTEWEIFCAYLVKQGGNPSEYESLWRTISQDIGR